MNIYTCGLQVLDADNGRQLESSTGRVATRDMAVSYTHLTLPTN